MEKDPDGNASPPSDPIVIVVDTVAPKAPTIEHIMDKVGKTTGEIHDDAYTDDPQPEMSGTGEAGATIAIYDNGKRSAKPPLTRMAVGISNLPKTH